MKNILLLVAATLLLCSFNNSTKNAGKPTALSLNDSTLFDFWVGNWEAHWMEKDSVKLLGENSIKKEMNDFVIQENFRVHAGASKGFVGSSWTVFDKNKHKWFQTWVDNQGAYMAFEAKPDGNNRIFERSTVNKKGVAIVQRMVFKDISASSFTWDWESSTDNGKTWALNWRIYYKRKK